jgi:hypothetical protein
MREILGVGWIDARRVSDALSTRGHDSGHKGQARTYRCDPPHDLTMELPRRNPPGEPHYET